MNDYLIEPIQLLENEIQSAANSRERYKGYLKTAEEKLKASQDDIQTSITYNTDQVKKYEDRMISYAVALVKLGVSIQQIKKSYPEFTAHQVTTLLGNNLNLIT